MDSNEADLYTSAMASPPIFSFTGNDSTTWSSPSQQSSSDFPPQVIRPCGACKSLRRGCLPTCVLAPYFPPNEPFKFMAVHRVFGASNVVKSLKELPESQRADAVGCLVYEAVARIKDPVYGCTGEICRLKKLVRQLQMQLDNAQAQLLNTLHQQESFSCDKSLISMEMEETPQPMLQQPLPDNFILGTPGFQIASHETTQSSLPMSQNILERWRNQSL